MRVEYEADFEGGGSLGLALTSYGLEAWEWAKTNETPKSEGAIRQSVKVAGWPADLFSIPVGRWTNQIVIVHAPDSVIVAPAVAAIANSRQVNPLNDPEQLLAVLENLRTYPE